ncbi:ty3-gypsy retrotransposon protein [Tanacetum coccineum]
MSLKELMQQVIQTPLQQKHVRKLMGFDFAIEYKTDITNVVADALSRVYDEADEVIAAFMALSQPLVSLVDDLRKENETLDELKIIHQKLERAESKVKELLLFKFHNTSMAGHSGVKKMLVGMSALFYWKRMQKLIEDFIRKCLVCQQTKYFTQAPTGLLQPLPTPLRVWEDVSMDFIMGLPVYKGLFVILVVVDRFTKYTHFGPLPVGFNTPKVAEQLFEASGTKLNHRTSYHPQTDRQTEVVNRGLEKYLRAMVSDRPQHWLRLFPWAEYSYNTNFHSSINMTSFQAVYGRLPPPIIPYPSSSTKVASVEELLIERDALLRQLKLAKRCSNKLAKRYYGPFKVLERIGKVVYRLALPEGSKIHPNAELEAMVPADEVLKEDGCFMVC